jgi:hypothetical protein
VKSVANQGKYEPQEIPNWLKDATQEAEDLALEMMQIWLDMTPEEQRRLVEVARNMNQGREGRRPRNGGSLS